MANELTTHFSEDHQNIAKQYVKKIIEILQSSNPELVSYALDTEYNVREAIKLKFGNIEVDVAIRTPK